MVGWWRFEDNFLDSSGNNNHGTQNGVLFTDGQFGRAASFNGLSSYVSIPNHAQFNMQNEITTSAWIHRTQDNSELGSIVQKWGDESNRRQWHLTLSDNNIRFYISTSGSNFPAVTGSVIPLNTWTHVVGRFDGNNLQVYVNGELDSTISLVGTIHQSNIGLRIGGYGEDSEYPSNRYFPGLIDEVMIFNRALSSDEIASLYNSQANQFENNYEDLDSGSYTIQGYAVDSSGNQFNTEERTIIVN